MSSREDVGLIGRSRELRTIADSLGDQATTGVVLVGEGGVGKTHLARHAVRTAHAAGFAVATVLATRAASTIPFGALEPIVGDDHESGSLAALRSARRRIRELADGAPLVLLVDDAHLLDDASATLVLQLAGDDNVFLLATVRSGEQVPDPVTALWKDAGALRLGVEPLSAAGTEALLEVLLGGPVPVAVQDRLTSLCRGLPLMLCELVEAARESGAIVQRDGFWCLEGELTVSDRLADLIGDRLAGCTDPEREALALVALGDPLAMPVARAAIGPKLLRALEDRRLVAVRPDDDVVTVAHPLYGEVALHQSGELRRRELLVALADATEAHARPSGQRMLRVAMWRLAAGAEVDADTLQRGAESAYRANDHEKAATLAAAAWERRPSIEAGHLHGLALGRLGRAGEAESVLARTESLLADDPDPDRMRVLVALARSENLFRGVNDADAAMSCVTSAEASTADRTWRDELVAHRAMLLLQLGQVRSAVELARPLTTGGVAERPFVKAAYAAGIGLAYAGRAEQAEALAKRALPVHERLWSEQLFQTEPAVHHVTAILSLVERGELTVAEQYAAFAVQVAREAGESYGLGYMSMLAGLVALRRGRMATARRRCLEAVPLFREAGYPSPLRWVLAGAAIAEAALGDLTSAERHLDQAEELTTETPVRLNEATLHEARGWLHVATGDLPGAHVAFGRGVDDAQARGELVSAAHLLHTCGRLGVAGEVVDRVAELSDSIDGELQRLRVDHLHALAAQDGAALDQVAAGFASLGADLLAAEAVAEAGRAHARAGNRRAATRATRTAAEHAARCEGAQTPAMTVTTSVEPLTDRERQVAILAADGLSSKQIAERLVLSRRTVDNHLQRVFGKLGISGRQQLAESLGRR